MDKERKKHAGKKLGGDSARTGAKKADKKGTETETTKGKFSNKKKADQEVQDHPKPTPCFVLVTKTLDTSSTTCDTECKTQTVNTK